MSRPESRSACSSTTSRTRPGTSSRAGFSSSSAPPVSGSWRARSWGRGRRSASSPAPCIASRRSRTRRSLRSRPRSWTTSCASRTPTAARAPPNLDIDLLRFAPMETFTVGQAAARSGWSPRMLRYVERLGLVVPQRSASGYRLYGLRELNQLRSLAELRRRFGLALDELAFAARLRREAPVRAAVDGWLAGIEDPAGWVEWEQRKHERLLAA